MTADLKTCGYCRQTNFTDDEFCSEACAAEAALSEVQDPIIGGEWQMMYGELLSGGDMALYSRIDGDDGYFQHIATFQRHHEELSDEDNTLSVNTAELLVRAPRMLDLIKRLAHHKDLDALQEDAATLLRELAREWGTAPLAED